MFKTNKLEVFSAITEEQALDSCFVHAHPHALCLTRDTKRVVFGGEVYYADRTIKEGALSYLAESLPLSRIRANCGRYRVVDFYGNYIGDMQMFFNKLENGVVQLMTVMTDKGITFKTRTCPVNGDLHGTSFTAWTTQTLGQTASPDPSVPETTYGEWVYTKTDPKLEIKATVNRLPAEGGSMLLYGLTALYTRHAVRDVFADGNKIDEEVEDTPITEPIEYNPTRVRLTFVPDKAVVYDPVIGEPDAEGRVAIVFPGSSDADAVNWSITATYTDSDGTEYTTTQPLYLTVEGQRLPVREEIIVNLESFSISYKSDIPAVGGSAMPEVKIVAREFTRSYYSDEEDDWEDSELRENTQPLTITYSGDGVDPVTGEITAEKNTGERKVVARVSARLTWDWKRLDAEPVSVYQSAADAPEEVGTLKTYVWKSFGVGYPPVPSEGGSVMPFVTYECEETTKSVMSDGSVVTKSVRTIDNGAEITFYGVSDTETGEVVVQSPNMKESEVTVATVTVSIALPGVTTVPDPVTVDVMQAGFVKELVSETTEYATDVRFWYDSSAVSSGGARRSPYLQYDIDLVTVKTYSNGVTEKIGQTLTSGLRFEYSLVKRSSVDVSISEDGEVTIGATTSNKVLAVAEITLKIYHGDNLVYESEPQIIKQAAYLSFWYVGQINATKTEFTALSADQLKSYAALPIPTTTKSANITINSSCWYAMIPAGEADILNAQYTAGGLTSTFDEDTIKNGFGSMLTHDDVTISGKTYKVYVNRNGALVNSNANGIFRIK